MRKLFLAAGAAAMAMTMPVLAQGKGNGGGKGGGGEAAHGHKADKGHGGGGGGHGRGRGGGHFEGPRAEKPHKAERGWAAQEARAEKQFRKQEAKAGNGWAKAEAKAEKNWQKSEAKAEKRFAKQEKRLREEDRRFRDDEFRSSGRNIYGGDDRRLASFDGGCPPGLAKKGNGCMPPGLAKKSFAVGERLPDEYYSSYNIPDQYRDWYPEGDDYSYRYDDGNIYRVDRNSNLISSLIPLLGGGFGVGSLLPAGYDVYNVPMQYRDDYYDTAETQYRYGDNAIFQVDPKSQMIEAVVALLAGDLNVGQILPAGYDTYNLPMEYRDQYVDSDEAMYRYADGNIYQVDPQTQMIEQIVAMLT